MYPVLRWVIPKYVIPKYVITLRELGRAMINLVNKEYEASILECKEIAEVAQFK